MTSHARTREVRTPSAPVRTGTLLAVLLAAQFMANVDNAVVNVAAPSIHATLRASGGELELVVSGYVLAVAMLLVTAARLGDTRGYRRVFLLGVAVFTVASLACALAPDVIVLIVARVAQGVGSALMVGQVLPGIALTFSGTARARALGRYAMTLAGSAVVGQVLGGVLVAADLFGTGWRPIFFVNVPVGAVLLLAAARFLPDRRPDPEARRRLDLPGVTILSVTMLLIVLPLVLGRDEGWPPWTWLSLGVGAAGLGVFAAVERRVAARGGYPLINLRVLARARVVWGLCAHGAATATYLTLLFVLALYLQQGLGRGPLFSGVALVSWVAAFGVAGPLLPRIPARLLRYVPMAGYLMLGTAYALTAWTAASPLAGGVALIAALGIGGFGLGTGFSSMVAHLTGAVPARYAPDIGGVITTIAQTAGAVGVAGFGTLYVSLAAGSGTATGTPQAGGPHAFIVVAAALAATAGLAAVAGWHATRPRNANPASTVPAPADRPAPA